ncbi:hypothetical protein Drorol1_Dr00004359 [Drosera rotundifolia]
MKSFSTIYLPSHLDQNRPSSVLCGSITSEEYIIQHASPSAVLHHPRKHGTSSNASLIPPPHDSPQKICKDHLEHPISLVWLHSQGRTHFDSLSISDFTPLLVNLISQTHPRTLDFRSLIRPPNQIRPHRT